MTSPSKRKGDRAELEVQTLLRELLGLPVRRALGAGRADDRGDIFGLPDTVVQVANWPANTLAAVRQKPVQAEAQRTNAGATHAATFVRLRGGCYRVVMTPEQFAALWKAARGAH